MAVIDRGKREHRAIWAFVVLIALVAVLITAAVMNRPLVRESLTEVYTPTYASVPFTEGWSVTLTHVWADLHTPSGMQFLRKMVPGQSGVLWLSLVLLLAIGIDFEHLGHPRNIDLIATQAVGVCMFEILRFFQALQSPTYVHLLDWVFSVIFALSLFLIARALWRIRRPVAQPWRQTLPVRALVAIVAVLVVCDVAVALVREPDDAGFFINLGAQRLRERHRLPYGDPLLDGSAGAAYGPLLYVAHVPFQLALAPTPVNAESPDRPVLGAASRYHLPPLLATKLCAITFHLIGVLALVTIGRRLAGEAAAWAVAALYCGSAYVLGVGGDESFIGGMTFVSHVAPAAATLLAFAALARPAFAGVLLTIATGIGLYPAFLAPAWLGHYWDSPRARWRFLAGLAIAGIAIAAGVLLLSRPAPDRTLIGTILFDTFGHHTDPAHYGNSPFGFWGQRTGIRGWMMHPLLAASSFSTPAFLLFAGFSAVSFRIARRTDGRQLALLTAAITIGATLLKIHPTGAYVAWYYPFLLLGLFARAAGLTASAPTAAIAHTPAEDNT